MKTLTVTRPSLPGQHPAPAPQPVPGWPVRPQV